MSVRYSKLRKRGNGECEAYVALSPQMGALVKVEHKSVLADDAEKVEFSIDTTNVVI